MVKRLPRISVIMPTLNATRTLELSLKSIKNQNYSGNLEIIIADGGSTDKTLEVANKFNAKIVNNQLKTAEAGKAIGVKFTKGEILAFIDSDNILPKKDWFTRMVQPFVDDRTIIASEPLYFTYRKKDHWLTRYFALIGMGDPLSYFIGNFDRYSYLSKSWTKLAINYTEKQNYLVLDLNDEIPTIGANGFLIKKSEFKKYPVKDYLFDIDFLRYLAQSKSVKVAKVKIGVVHLFSGNIATFIRKQRRRIRDYLYFQKTGIRINDQSKSHIFWGVLKFILATILIFPVFIQTIIGFSRKKDRAWLFHPLACWLTLFCYVFELIRSLFNNQQFDRSKWSQ